MLFEWPFSGSWKLTWPEKPPKRVSGGAGLVLVFGLGRVLGGSWGLLGLLGPQELILIDF